MRRRCRRCGERQHRCACTVLQFPESAWRGCGIIIDVLRGSLLQTAFSSRLSPFTVRHVLGGLEMSVQGACLALLAGPLGVPHFLGAPNGSVSSVGHRSGLPSLDDKRMVKGAGGGAYVGIWRIYRGLWSEFETEHFEKSSRKSQRLHYWTQNRQYN